MADMPKQLEILASERQFIDKADIPDFSYVIFNMGYMGRASECAGASCIVGYVHRSDNDVCPIGRYIGIYSFGDVLENSRRRLLMRYFHTPDEGLAKLASGPFSSRDAGCNFLEYGVASRPREVSLPTVESCLGPKLAQQVIDRLVEVSGE